MSARSLPGCAASPASADAEPSATERVAAAIREVAPDFDVNDMQRMAVNVLHASGSLPRDLRRKAAHAIIALRLILEAAA